MAVVKGTSTSKPVKKPKKPAPAPKPVGPTATAFATKDKQAEKQAQSTTSKLAPSKELFSSVGAAVGVNLKGKDLKKAYKQGVKAGTAPTASKAGTDYISATTQAERKAKIERREARQEKRAERRETTTSSQTRKGGGGTKSSTSFGGSNYGGKLGPGGRTTTSSGGAGGRTGGGGGGRGSTDGRGEDNRPGGGFKDVAGFRPTAYADQFSTYAGGGREGLGIAGGGGGGEGTNPLAGGTNNADLDTLLKGAKKGRRQRKRRGTE